MRKGLCGEVSFCNPLSYSSTAAKRKHSQLVRLSAIRGLAIASVRERGPGKQPQVDLDKRAAMTLGWDQI